LFIARVLVKTMLTGSAPDSAPDLAPVLAPASKKRKVEQVLTSKPVYVLVSSIDEPDKPLEVELALIQGVECRLYLTIKNTPPATTPSGKSFWRSGMTKALLITLVRSLTVGELVLAKGATLGEALTMFEYEGVHVGRTRNAVPCIDRPRAGIAFRKSNDAQERLQSLCEAMADSIMSWPRLESELYDMVSSNSPAVSMTRAWIRFPERPKSGNEGSSQTLVRRNPQWFEVGLLYLGAVHARMVADKPELSSKRDEAAFNALCAEVESENANSMYRSHFAPVQMDAIKTKCDAKMRKLINKAEKFCNEIKGTIIEQAVTPEGNATLALQYARAVTTFIETTFNSTPHLSSIFSGVFADEGGSTPERTALKKALKTRGVSVIRWCDERDPSLRCLVFPPTFAHQSTSHTGPAVLLGFEGVV
jgi:hypothetical protein